MTRTYTIRPVNRKKMFDDDVEVGSNAITLEDKAMIIYPNPIEPDKPKWDGIETIGTLRRFSKQGLKNIL